MTIDAFLAYKNEQKIRYLLTMPRLNTQANSAESIKNAIEARLWLK